VEAENPGEKLKPGASVHAAIITEMFKAATVVPVSAILPGEEKGTAVLTVSADSTAHKKQVELGIREGDKVQILSGVKPGEEVVVVGGLGVDDKAKVKVISTTVEESDEDEAPAPDNAKKDEAKPKAK
jgi:multidrug efflux pump subunit AcrA (membrane-fusion protein)